MRFNEVKNPLYLRISWDVYLLGCIQMGFDVGCNGTLLINKHDIIVDCIWKWGCPENYEIAILCPIFIHP